MQIGWPNQSLKLDNITTFTFPAEQSVTLHLEISRHWGFCLPFAGDNLDFLEIS